MLVILKVVIDEKSGVFFLKEELIKEKNDIIYVLKLKVNFFVFLFFV